MPGKRKEYKKIYLDKHANIFYNKIVNGDLAILFLAYNALVEGRAFLCRIAVHLPTARAFYWRGK